MAEINAALPRQGRQEGFVISGRARIHYTDWGGNGTSAHFLHANGFCAGTYGPWIPHLSDGLRVVGSDVRGQGDSDPLADISETGPILDWRPFAKDIKAVVEATLQPPVIGIGHSLGAVLTYMAAAIYPGLFSRIVLIEPVIFPNRLLWLIRLMRRFGISVPLANRARRRKARFESRAAARARFTAGRGIFGTWQPPFIQAYLDCGLKSETNGTAVLKCHPETEARFFDSVPLDIWQYAKSIRCPVLALRGANSDTFRPDAAWRLQRAIPDCQAQTVPDASHFIPMEKPAECARRILDFLG